VAQCSTANIKLTALPQPKPTTTHTNQMTESSFNEQLLKTSIEILDEQTGAVGIAFACQNALRQYLMDETVELTTRLRVVPLLLWIAREDPNILQQPDIHLVGLLHMLRRYPVTDKDSQTLREFHPIAVNSITRILAAGSCRLPTQAVPVSGACPVSPV